MTIPGSGQTYDDAYFQTHCGLPYERSTPWLQFFGTIAENVVQQFSPKTALDAGCAIGILVEALRNYGVDAEGFDISEYAVSQVPEYLKPYIKIDNILNPAATSKHYDLVVCIEVLEHLTEAEADTAIANIARWGDTVLFSSSPEDFSETTHVNVQKPGYWIEKFAQHGLIYNPMPDTSYVTPWAMVFQRRTAVLPQILRDYGDVMWTQKREVLQSRQMLQQAHEQNTLLIQEYEAFKNKRLPSESGMQAYVDAAAAQEKRKRILLTQAYMAQIDELRRQLADGQKASMQTASSAPAETPASEEDSGEIISIPDAEVMANIMAQMQVPAHAGPMNLGRVRAIMGTATSILLSEGPGAFANRTRRWLRGERRYFPLHSQNQVASALIPQNFPTSRKKPTLDNFTVLFIVPMPEISSKRYRVFNIQEQLQKKNIKSNWIDESEFLREPVRALYFDVVVFARVIYHAEMTAFLEHARKLRIRVVFEIDDLLFDVSMLQYITSASNLQPREQRIYLDGMKGYFEMLLRCDYFISSTEHIANAASAWGKKTYIIRNGMNDRQVELAEQALQMKAQTPEIRIGYLSGSYTHQEDFAIVVPALVRILGEFPQARLVIQGLIELPESLAAFEAQIEKRPYVSWEQLVQDTARLDINLAPLEINPFTSGKSALKYFEAAIVEVPTIASPIEDFRVAIQHGETGYLASAPEEWYTFLRALITDPELRERVGRNARQDALARYTSEAQSDHTLSVYQHILSGLDATTTLPGEVQKTKGAQSYPQARSATPEHRGIRFQESALVHYYLDGLRGLEIGAAAHNPFGLQTKNVGLTREFDAEDYDFFKASQIKMCGEWARIDIPASAEDIPVADNSQDFVLSSHVWEHLASPLLALEEWARVVRPNGYILAIVPKRDAEPRDVGRPITPIEELIRHYKQRSTVDDRKREETIPNLHFTVFSPESIREITEWFNSAHPSIQLLEIAFLETDDKVGNGHLILWKVVKTAAPAP